MYIVTFVLSIPSQDVFHKSVDTHQIMRSGSSQLMVTRKIHEATVQATYGHQQYDVRVSVNSQGFLTSAQLRIHADNFAEAERLGFNILCPILSHLSFTYNVALDFTAYEIKEEKTETTSWWLAILGQPKLLNL